MKHFEELYIMVKYHAGLQSKVDDMVVKGGASLTGINGRASPRSDSGKKIEMWYPIQTTLFNI